MNDHTTDTPLRRCSKCGEYKPATTEYFYSAPKGRLFYVCKVCHIAKMAARSFSYEHKPDVMKTCSRCGQSFPHTKSFFHGSKQHVGGLSVYCKACASAIRGRTTHSPIDSATRVCLSCHLSYPETPDFFYRNRCAPNGLMSECKTCQDTRVKEWRSKNPLALVRHNAARRAKSGQYSIATKNWRRKNKDRPRIWNERRSARKRNLPDTLTNGQWERALDYFDHKCAVCGRPRGLWHTLAMDHWIPLSDPRPDNPGSVASNIVPLCHGTDGCNNEKQNRDAEQWLIAKYGQRRALRIIDRILNYFAWVVNQLD